MQTMLSELALKLKVITVSLVNKLLFIIILQVILWRFFSSNFNLLILF